MRPRLLAMTELAGFTFRVGKRTPVEQVVRAWTCSGQLNMLPTDPGVYVLRVDATGDFFVVGDIIEEEIHDRP